MLPKIKLVRYIWERLPVKFWTIVEGNSLAFTQPQALFQISASTLKLAYRLLKRGMLSDSKKVLQHGNC
jgi:hypothetical protein